MNQTSVLIPILSTLSAFILISCIRFLDVFEREPYKLIFINFLFGILSYLISAISVSLIFGIIDINKFVLGSSTRYVFLIVLVTAMIMLISQLIFSILSLLFFRKDFDTMPDYIIYFSTIGIGFNFSEVFFYNFLNKTNNQLLLQISDNLYFSSFFNGTTLPFLMGAIGAGYYLSLISKKENFNSLYKVSILTVGLAILTQIIFYSMNFFIMISSPHTPSEFLNVIKEIKIFAQSFSITLLILSVGFAVIFDAYIISNFLEKVVSNSKNKSFKLVNASNFINPFLYLSLSKLKYFSALKGKQDISEKNLKTFAKLALKNFNDPKNSFLYIAEANEILDKS